MNAKIIIEVGDDSVKVEMEGSKIDLIKGTSTALWDVLDETREPGVSDNELIAEAKDAVIAARRACKLEIDIEKLKKIFALDGR